jgi:hypothetical protein
MSAQPPFVIHGCYRCYGAGESHADHKDRVESVFPIRGIRPFAYYSLRCHELAIRPNTSEPQPDALYIAFDIGGQRPGKPEIVFEWNRMEGKADVIQEGRRLRLHKHPNGSGVYTNLHNVTVRTGGAGIYIGNICKPDKASYAAYTPGEHWSCNLQYAMTYQDQPVSAHGWVPLRQKNVVSEFTFGFALGAAIGVWAYAIARAAMS